MDGKQEPVVDLGAGPLSLNAWNGGSYENAWETEAVSFTPAEHIPGGIRLSIQYPEESSRKISSIDYISTELIPEVVQRNGPFLDKTYQQYGEEIGKFGFRREYYMYIPEDIYPLDGNGPEETSFGDYNWTGLRKFRGRVAYPLTNFFASGFNWVNSVNNEAYGVRNGLSAMLITGINAIESYPIRDIDLSKPNKFAVEHLPPRKSGSIGLVRYYVNDNELMDYDVKPYGIYQKAIPETTSQKWHDNQNTKYMTSILFNLGYLGQIYNRYMNKTSGWPFPPTVYSVIKNKPYVEFGNERFIRYTNPEQSLVYAKEG